MASNVLGGAAFGGPTGATPLDLRAGFSLRPCVIACLRRRPARA